MQRHFNSIFIQVKHESNSRLVAKPTRNSKSNFLLVLFSLLELLVGLLRSFLVLYHRSKDIRTWLFGLNFSFRFHSDSGYSGLWPTEIWSDCYSWLIHFELRRIFYIEDILSQDSFLVVILLTNRSKWIAMLIERASSIILFFPTLCRGLTRRKKRAVFALRASSARQLKLLILLNIGG